MKKRITKAKTILFTCVIGLFITLSAYAITNFITTKLGGAPSATAPPGGPGIAPPQAVVGCCMSFVINGTLQTTECYEGYTKAECEDESDEASGVRDSWLPTECSVDRRCPQYPEKIFPNILINNFLFKILCLKDVVVIDYFGRLVFGSS